MTTLIPAAERATSGLLIAILGSELLLALSFVRLWGDANSAAFRTSVIETAMSGPIWGTALAWNLVAFAAALLLTHLLLGVTAWCLAKLARRTWPRSQNSLRVWSLFWLVWLAIWIFAANAAWFPSASLANSYSHVLQATVFGASVFVLVTIAMLAPVAWLIVCNARDAWPFVSRRPKWAIGALAVGGGAAALASFGVSSAPGTAATRDRPHVIFIGLDSLRPDALRAEHGRAVTPAINDFLSDSAVLSDTLTPLARTFPAWVSIVSGKHPHTTGAVINLLPRELIGEGDTLPKLLTEVGYHTVYATDEVRFSNLDETYGFEEMIAPPMGATDFLLGFFGDTPLANLLVNTRAGELLFRHAYANRAAAVTYDPDTFIERLDARLRFDEPTFLAVHLTLVHWPYTWATTPPREPEAGGAPGAVEADKYRRAVVRLDQQFGDLIEMLRDRGALQNAIVVVLSDHGEALGESASLADEGHAARHVRGLSSSIGHGTSVFVEGQYRVLLALQSFGAEELPTPRGLDLRVPASLEDLAPTIADALELTPKQPFDGISWLDELGGAPSAHAERRIRFMETELSPPGFESGLVLSHSALQGAVGFYRIDAKTDRVLIRAERLQEILRNRQYAATRGAELLAAVPADDERQQHVVYLERSGAEPIWLTTAPTAAGDVGYELWNALQARFAPVRERPVIPPLGNVE